MKTKYLRFILYFSSLALILLMSQTAFFYFQNIQAQKSVIAVQAILRQEITSSNTFLISRTLSDLEKSEFLKCVRLIETQTGQEHLDLTFKGDCKHNPWMLSGKRVSIDLKSLNGTEWKLEFETINGDFFFLSLWLSRLLLSLVAIGSLSLYFHREDKFTKEKEHEYNKKEKLKELASQAAHDVASPLTLFHALMDSDLVEAEAKDFLKQGIERVTGIVGHLREQSKMIEEGEAVAPVQIDLVAAISDIVKEKRAISHEISWQAPNSPVLAIADLDDFKRVLSNVINNALEASSGAFPLVEITLLNTPTPTVQVKDWGKGIPSEILPEIGRKGMSFGKEGLGLGLHHAKNCMDQWGGSLEIKSRVGKGTVILLKLKYI